MDETALYNLKWFDYRPLPPDVATMAFVCHYAKVLGHYYDMLGEDGGFVLAHNSIFIRPMVKSATDERGWCYGPGKGDANKKLDYARPHEWRNFEVAQYLRQWADKRFLRYDHFCEVAFQVYNDFGIGTKGIRGKTWRFIPMAIFKSPRILSEIKGRLAERHADQVVLSDLEYFQAKAFVGHQLQVDYTAYVVSGCRRMWPSTFKDKLLILVENGRLTKKILDVFSSA